MGTPQPDRARRFARLYDSHYADVLRFVQRRAGPGPAEDVVHEAFLVAWRRFDDLPARDADARAWLFATARNCMLNARRGERRQDALTVRIADHVAHSTGAPDDHVVPRLDLVRAWARLDGAQQEVLALALWDDLTSPQAGRVLGISASAYRIRLHRARAALRRHLDTDPSPANVRLAAAPLPE